MSLLISDIKRLRLPSFTSNFIPNRVVPFKRKFVVPSSLTMTSQDSNKSDVSLDSMSVSEESSNKCIWWEALKGTACKIGSDIKSLFSPITSIFSSKKESESTQETEELLADVGDGKGSEVDALGVTQEDMGGAPEAA